MRHLAIPLLTDKPVPAIGVGAMPLSEPRADGEVLSRQDAVAVVTDEDVDPQTGPAAYRVELTPDGVVETRLAPGSLA